MAKRVRGSRSTHRPGGQGPSRSKKNDESTTSAATSEATAVADIDGAVDSVSASYTELAIEEAAPAPTKSRRARRTPKVKADSLSARVAAENVYVREDLRRIGVVSIVLIIGLAVAWVLFYAMDILGLY